MTLLGRLLLALSILSLIGAIWLPGSLWQLILTALILFITGGALLGRSDRADRA
jgi:hypothetical protein